MHPDVENDAALRGVLAPRGPRPQARSALNGNRREPPESTGADDLTGTPNGRIEAELVTDAQDHASVAAGGGHLAGVRHRHRKRLLAQHMLLSSCSREHGGMMQGVRQGDVDRVEARVVHHRLEVTVNALNAETLREPVPFVERAAETG